MSIATYDTASAVRTESRAGDQESPVSVRVCLPGFMPV